MPDLHKVMTRTCISNFSWCKKVKSSDGVTDHLVTFNIHGGWICTCAAFRYRKTCRHITHCDRHERCGWGTDAFANVIYDEEICPECGEDTIPFYVGV